MARPRVIRLPEGGEVILKNLLPERQAAITGFLAGTEEEEAVPVEDNNEMLGRAISIYHNPDTNVYSLVTVAFSPLTKKGEVVSIEEIGTNKFLTTNEFKKTAVKYNFV